MKENSQLKNEKIQLQKEVGKLNTEISSLQANIKIFYIDKQKRSLKSDLRRLKTFKGIVKNELDNKGVDNHFECEHKKEMNRHRGYDREH
ncbi:hypothetical protein ABB10_24825 [Bacillus thuringiensis]|uniref:Uncharacterized protein n=1 Tax=Bacillus thuringiensis DB27 TaxID=1431339 RepID=W8YDH8_BACTU|nr:hypothetical protein [Bacillus thuringiensis]MBG9633490.1 hypothetical protein [Bacillus thuringiensis]MBG9668579.1 hypothetical protein [Bacillus thuringiensis]MBH0355308.1 hypothetical protein [Bacillus thuringiensis]CDN39553.1 unnamed protein product [Bacillus thuringiensis DB27]